MGDPVVDQVQVAHGVAAQSARNWRAESRSHTQCQCSDTQSPTAISAALATHDCAEALAVADRVAVLHSGRVTQVATPADAYARPADLTAARLTGPVL